MKYFFISDIHGNYDALTSVLEYRSKHYPKTEIVCLGDIVGYGAQPIECINEIFNLTDKIILGNHDSGLINKTEIIHFSSNAKKVIKWSQKLIRFNNIKFLKKIPLSMQIDDFLIVHSSPSSPDRWKYVTSIYKAKEEFESTDYKKIFFGHTHIPLIFKKDDNDVKMLFDDELTLEHNNRYFINPGSIGQPRNSDNRSSAMIYDSETMELLFLKIPYDIKAAQKKIIDAGLPVHLAERLEKGI